MTELQTQKPLLMEGENDLRLGKEDAKYRAEKFPKGRVHKGTYGNEYQGDEDDEADDKKKTKAAKPAAEKRGRGRPKKNADATGNVKKYDAKGLQGTWLSPNHKKPTEAQKKALANAPKHKNTLKDWFEQLNKEMIAENNSVRANWSDPTERGPGVRSSQQRGQDADDQFVRDVVSKNRNEKRNAADDAWAKSKGTKPDAELDEVAPVPMTGTSTSTATAPKIGQKVIVKPGQPSGQTPPATMTTQTGQTVATGPADQIKKLGDLVNTGGVALTKPGTNQPLDEEGDEGKPGKNFAKIAKGAAERYGSKAAGNRVAGAIRAKLMKQGKIKEADMPPNDSLMSPISEGKVKELSMDLKELSDIEFKAKYKKSKAEMRKECNAKPVTAIAESRIEEATEYTNEKVAKILAQENPNLDVNSDDFVKAVYDELIAIGMTPKAARYNIRYDEDFMSDTASAYEHFKKHSVVDENRFAADNPEMSDDDISDYWQRKQEAAHERAKDERKYGAWDRQAETPKPESSFDMKLDEITQSIAFESLEKQLDALLNEGMTISMSQGQQGAPDSVSVNATDAEAEELKAFVKNAGIFGDADEVVNPEGDLEGAATHGGLEVVDGHDGMMALMKKISGGGDDAEEYADELDGEGDAECAGPECDAVDVDSEEVVDETDTPDQKEYEMAEDDETAETTADENAEASEDQALAVSDNEEVDEDRVTGFDGSGNPILKSAVDAGHDEGERIKKNKERWAKMYEPADEEESEEEEKVDESLANGADDTFEADIDFMTNIVSGGLNRQKRDQTTLPHTQVKVSESNNLLSDWIKLSGIK